MQSVASIATAMMYGNRTMYDLFITYLQIQATTQGCYLMHATVTYLQQYVALLTTNLLPHCFCPTHEHTADQCLRKLPYTKHFGHMSQGKDL